MVEVPPVHGQWAPKRSALRVFAGLLTLIVLIIPAGIILSPLVNLWIGETPPPTRYVQLPDRQKIRTATAIEIERIAQLEFANSPLPPTSPPLQSAPVPRPNDIFGDSADRAQVFAAFRRHLEVAECGFGNASDMAALADAESELGRLQTNSSFRAARFHYHRGVVQLCGGDPVPAGESFEAAATILSEARASQPHQSRWIAQYRAATAYGQGLSLLLASEAAIPEALEKLESARVFAASGKYNREGGPFVRFSAAGCSSGLSSPACEMFDWSTAEAVNAILYASLKGGGGGQGANAARSDLAGSIGQLLDHPNAAANFAVLEAKAGRFSIPSRLFVALQAKLQADEERYQLWIDTPALARIAALGAIAQAELPDGGIAGFSGASDIFSTPSLSAADRTALAPWRRIRADRAMLEEGDIAGFAARRAETAEFARAEDRAFITTWRGQILAIIGEGLLERTEAMRGAPGGEPQRQALLSFLQSSEFDMEVRRDAALYAAGWTSPALAYSAATGATVVVAFLIWVIYNLVIGYRRTFTRRHFNDRTAWT